MNAPDPYHWVLISCFGAFLSVWVHLGPFRYCTKLGAINVKVRATKSCHNFLQRMLTIHTIGQKTHVFVCFFLFGCIWDRYAIARKHTKLVQLMQKFVPQCLVRIFPNERSRSIPLDPNLMFWCVSFRMGAFGTILLLQETCSKTRQTSAINAKVRATMPC
jgi:hypothetical protein